MDGLMLTGSHMQQKKKKTSQQAIARYRWASSRTRPPSPSVSHLRITLYPTVGWVANAFLHTLSSVDRTS